MRPVVDASYYDLGKHSLEVSTRSPDAQIWFDRGLNWIYGFNFEEAVECFERALDHDPSCVMAYWGVAFGVGCNYNKEWRMFSPTMVSEAMTRAREALDEARDYLREATDLERRLVLALDKRFQAPGYQSEAVLCRWNVEYADAMREVYRAYPDDWDLAALFADALIMQTPWKLWDPATGEPASGTATQEAVDVLERALAQIDAAGARAHPGLIHTYIHTIEMSSYPERALPRAAALRDLVPDSGHLQHMGSHIQLLCGYYHEAVVTNDRAIEVDRKYAERGEPHDEYTHYRAHNIHFKAYAAMMLGQYGAALEAAQQMQALVTDDVLAVQTPPLAYFLEPLVSIKLHVLIRFGRWQDILAEPFPGDRALYCYTIAMLHYARGIAQATLGRFDEAQRERRAFAEAKRTLPEHRYMIKNTCADVLEVAQAMLDGEVEFHTGNDAAAFESLRRAVFLDDRLEYMEPWGWMMPTRHPLGALLLARGHVDEAAAVYRADLGLDGTLRRALQHPDNVWSLSGYLECLRQLGRDQEVALLQPRLDIALAWADVEIPVSCFCALAGQPQCCRG